MGENEATEERRVVEEQGRVIDENVVNSLRLNLGQLWQHQITVHTRTLRQSPTICSADSPPASVVIMTPTNLPLTSCRTFAVSSWVDRHHIDKPRVFGALNVGKTSARRTSSTRSSSRCRSGPVYAN